VTVLASLTSWIDDLVTSYGLPLLFVLIFVETAGVPLPGETALIVAGILASQGKLDITYVIVVAAVAAILGDNTGYWIAREWGRALIERSPRLQGVAARTLPRTERFFERHGGKTIFLARFVAFLRFTAAWAAGLGKMHWLHFFVWNAAGGIAWAVTIGLVSYYAGRAAADAINKYGLYAGAAVVAIVVLGYVGLHLRRRRAAERAG
jgi:membrane protein DedA with SNARE-associated domain